MRQLFFRDIQNPETRYNPHFKCRSSILSSKECPS